MGILKRLFGGGGDGGKGQGEASPAEATEYNGYRIRPAPYAVEGQFQTAGIIEKDFPDGAKEHRFVRAERHGSKEEAASFALSKGRQIIDQLGDRIFQD